MALRIKNFRDCLVVDDTQYAVVDVKENLFSLYRPRGIFKSIYLTHWRYLDTGDFVPGDAATLLYNAFVARQKLDERLREQLSGKTNAG